MDDKDIDRLELDLVVEDAVGKVKRQLEELGMVCSTTAQELAKLRDSIESHVLPDPFMNYIEAGCPFGTTQAGFDKWLERGTADV